MSCGLHGWASEMPCPNCMWPDKHLFVSLQAGDPNFCARCGSGRYKDIHKTFDYRDVLADLKERQASLAAGIVALERLVNNEGDIAPFGCAPASKGSTEQ